MQWSDEAIILSVRPHGETAAIVELLTRSHGRHLGLVHGGRSRRQRATLQIGNHVDATWKGRLSEQLGHMQIEPRRGYAATAMQDAAALAAIGSMTALARLLPERDPHPSLYEITLFVLGFIDDETAWPALLVRWEMALLDELGFGLDLTRCASTGSADDLVYVSPRTGRAVSREAGALYADRLLPLPAFLLPRRQGDRAAPVTSADLEDGLRLTRYFIEHRLLEPVGQTLPDPRARLSELVARLTSPSPGAPPA